MLDKLPIRGIGHVSDIGTTRPGNEDEYVVFEEASPGDLPCAFFGVYDGHGGPQTSRFLKKNLHKNILSNSAFPNDMKRAFVTGYETTDEQILDRAVSQNLLRSCGSTSTTVLMTENTLHVAHLGDSRGVLCRNGRAYDLTRDHRAHQVPTERARVEKSGGWISKFGYVNGNLAVSRAFGDIEFKRNKNKVFSKRKWTADPVIATPEYKEIPLSGDDSFFVLASDGLWDDMSSQEVVDEIGKLLRRYRDPQAVAKKMIDYLINHGSSQDNITMIIVWLDQEAFRD